jgi:hypothetical protein
MNILQKPERKNTITPIEKCAKYLKGQIHKRRYQNDK